MSAGAGPAVGAHPAPARSLTLTRLHQELWHARDLHEDTYAAQLEAQIARLSQGSPASPRTETRTRRKT